MALPSLSIVPMDDLGTSQPGIGFLQERSSLSPGVARLNHTVTWMERVVCKTR